MVRDFQGIYLLRNMIVVLGDLSWVYLERDGLWKARLNESDVDVGELDILNGSVQEKSSPDL